MTRHLSDDELIDLADGARARADVPHLGACDECVGRLDALTVTMSAVADLDVPEPSPLFWDHLSARVHDAVRLEGAPGRRGPVSWMRSFGARLGTGAAHVGYMVAGGALAGGAVLALLVALTLRSGSSGTLSIDGSTGPAPLAVNLPANDGSMANDSLSDDPSLALVAELTTDMDWDTARSAGLTVDGSAENAVTHLSEGELRQLRRLLQKELARAGA